MIEDERKPLWLQEHPTTGLQLLSVLTALLLAFPALSPLILLWVGGTLIFSGPRARRESGLPATPAQFLPITPFAHH